MGKNINKKVNCDWCDIYSELAVNLLNYENDRKTLITLIEKCFDNIGLVLPKLENGGKAKDIDPFTIFGLFNKRMKDESRLAILKEFKSCFNLKSALPTSFDGIPTLMPLSATFYYFDDARGENDIDNLWSLLKCVINYLNKCDKINELKLCEIFDVVKEQKGISWRITTGLFWIAPSKFISLDSINRWYLSDYNAKVDASLKEKIKELIDVPTCQEYLHICDMVSMEVGKKDQEFNNFIELSAIAADEAYKINKSEKERKKQLEKIEIDENAVRYWLFSPGNNADKWNDCRKNGIMMLGWGDLGEISKTWSKNDIKEKMKAVFGDERSFKNDAHALWQFVNVMKPGDVIFVKKGMHKIIGKGIVTSDYRYVKRNDDYNNVRQVNWVKEGDYEHPGQAVMKVLTEITPYTDYVQRLEELFGEDIVDDNEKPTTYPPYTKQDFLKKVYFDSKDYDTLVSLLMHEKNIILEGAPGVGKTYIAKKLAYSIIGEANPERVEMIQFHQSYSYEDFIIGYRPTENHFALHNGVFYDFCKKAEKDDPNNPYFFIIDEINRGNLSKIFGELFMLIEKDKRDIKIPLLYGDQKFSIPKNVYIIGTMNTADRSIAILDYALRRRFAFYDISPKFDNEAFNDYACAFDNEKFINLLNCVKDLNLAISKDESLGEGFAIGHSYFCELENVDDQVLFNIVEYKLIPLIKEYWFDEVDKVNKWSEALRSTIK